MVQKKYCFCVERGEQEKKAHIQAHTKTLNINMMNLGEGIQEFFVLLIFCKSEINSKEKIGKEKTVQLIVLEHFIYMEK